MARRLDLPEEFVFADGMRIGSPSELARVLNDEAEREVEVWGRLEEGDLHQWLKQGGWESQARAIAHLRNRGSRERVELFRALTGMFESEPRQTAQIRDETHGGDQSHQSQQQLPQLPHQPAEQPQDPSSASDLITRQRTAVRAFLSARSHWRASEQAERDRRASLCTEAQQAARAAQAVVEDSRESVRQALDSARQVLTDASASRVVPWSTEGLVTAKNVTSRLWRESELRVAFDATDPASALEQSVRATHEHESNLQAAVRDLRQLRERQREEEESRQRELQQQREREREEEEQRQQDEAAQRRKRSELLAKLVRHPAAFFVTIGILAAFGRIVLDTSFRSAPPPAAAARYDGTAVRITGSEVNVRAEPFPQSLVLFRANENEVFWVIRERDNWVEIDLSRTGRSGTGWVNRAYVEAAAQLK